MENSKNLTLAPINKGIIVASALVELPTLPSEYFVASTFSSVEEDPMIVKLKEDILELEETIKNEPERGRKKANIKTLGGLRKMLIKREKEIEKKKKEKVDHNIYDFDNSDDVNIFILTTTSPISTYNTHSENLKKINIEKTPAEKYYEKQLARVTAYNKRNSEKLNEKSRAYFQKIKNDPEKYKKYLLKKREYYAKRKSVKKDTKL